MANPVCFLQLHSIRPIRARVGQAAMNHTDDYDAQRNIFPRHDLYVCRGRLHNVKTSVAAAKLYQCAGLHRPGMWLCAAAMLGLDVPPG